MKKVPFKDSVRAARLIDRENIAASQGAVTELSRTVLLHKFTGVAGCVIWHRLSSKSLLDGNLFKFRSMQRHQLAHHLWPDPEGTFDKTHFAPDAGLKLEGAGLLLPECTHGLEALDRGSGRLH